ncbi:unnamed protein product, partial [Mesorhabditis spiculigera]
HKFSYALTTIATKFIVGPLSSRAGQMAFFCWPKLRDFRWASVTRMFDPANCHCQRPIDGMEAKRLALLLSPDSQ